MVWRGLRAIPPERQGDQPGPWSFASCFILRAEHEAGLFDRSRRTLEWLNSVQGGRTGAWFEEIPVTRSSAPKSGILPWTSGEISLFVVRHLLGVGFDGRTLVIKPALYPHSPPVNADLRFRASRLKLRITGAGSIRFAEVNGRRVETDAQGRCGCRSSSMVARLSCTPTRSPEQSIPSRPLAFPRGPRTRATCSYSARNASRPLSDATTSAGWPLISTVASPCSTSP